MRYFSRFLASLAAIGLTSTLAAQEELLDSRWYRIESQNFILVSEASARQTRRFVEQLEVWRQISAQLIADVDAFPTANVPNYVFLFDNEESFQHFTVGQERAFFYPTPRSNFMAIIRGDDGSLFEGLHHYSHFLMRNFYDLRLPRWYEEGMAGYLARMRVDGDGVEFERVSADSNEALRAISESLSMDRLLYRDDALASPRLIQIANLKSQSLMHYLLHAHEDDLVDRRDQLQRYLELIFEGRTLRFAFDQAFDVTTEELDEEFHAYLSGGSRARGEVNNVASVDLSASEPQELSQSELAILLGELGLNTGQAENAEYYFSSAMDVDPTLARAYSGLGDSLRFQEVAGRDQEIAALFDRALELSSNDADILLDYGEYWESELNDCSKDYPAAERSLIIERIKQSFEQALALAPSNAEAHLAMGQVYLFPEENWSPGRDYQRRAFELLPADSFIMEQAVRYAIEAEEFENAATLIDEMSQPLHYFGVPGYVNDLRLRMESKRNNSPYEACAE